ncbi:hypothetical protein FRC03_007126 [Tulasnella sp. 419]|nr:hypothetical protein FRC03_007126 [Tulasnella sp. 419]
MSNPPTRADRQKCYAARDTYFTCLDRLGVIAPGDEGSKCAKELKEFEAFCAKSWVSQIISLESRFRLDNNRHQRSITLENEGFLMLSEQQCWLQTERGDDMTVI